MRKTGGRAGKLYNYFPWLCGLLVFISTAGMSILRYLTCSNDNFDLAFYTRMVWGITYGDRFNTLIGAHQLGLHLSPILYVFVPFSLVFSPPVVLLVAQAFSLGIAAPIVAKMAFRRTSSPVFAMLVAGMWFFYPAVIQVGAREFHPSVLAVAPLIAGVDGVDSRKYCRGIFLLLLAVFCREDVALVVSVVMILFLLRGKHSLWMRCIFGLTAFFSVVYFSMYVFFIQPIYLPAEGSIDQHFAGMGHSAGQVLGYILDNPVEVAGRIFTEENFFYLLWVLLPLGFTSLLDSLWLLPAAVPAVINMLSSFPDSKNPSGHYSIMMVPFIFYSASGGLRKIAEKLAGMGNIRFWILSFFTSACCIYSHFQHGALPFSKKFHIDRYRYGRNNGILCWYAGMVKDNRHMSAVAPYGALAHLADRRRIYSIDFVHPKPDIAIVDISQRLWITLSIKRWFNKWEVEYERLISDPDYIISRSNPPYELLMKKKGGGRARIEGVSVREIPPYARKQDIQWEDFVRLEALEAYLRIESEKFTGTYAWRIVVKMVFYWRALRRLPDELFLKCSLEGRGKRHVRFSRPTYGIRRTSSWRSDEIIKDKQVFLSPGGWPLKEITAWVVFVDRWGRPFPEGAQPRKLVWPEWEAERDR